MDTFMVVDTGCLPTLKCALVRSFQLLSHACLRRQTGIICDVLLIREKCKKTHLLEGIFSRHGACIKGCFFVSQGFPAGKLPTYKICRGSQKGVKLDVVSKPAFWTICSIFVALRSHLPPRQGYSQCACIFKQVSSYFTPATLPTLFYIYGEREKTANSLKALSWCPF